MRRLPRPGRRSIVLHSTGLALTALLFAASATATAQQMISTSTDRPAAVRVSPIDQFIAEASARFGIPERWIRTVMQAESGGNPRAVSRAGAMGLMQIMPATWAELRARYGLGSDPFDPRGNILAGTAYLRAMYDRFGAPGFLAAYNAGPGRYAEHLRTGRPLPRETRAYVAQLAPRIGAPASAEVQTARLSVPSDWREAPLFATPSERVPRDREAAHAVQSIDRAEDAQGAETPRATPLFVSVQRRPEQ